MSVEVTSVSWLGQLPVGVEISDYCNCWFFEILSFVFVFFVCYLAWAVDLGFQIKVK